MLLSNKEHCQRIVDKDVSRIDHCSFDYLQTNGQGSAIHFSSLKSASLEIQTTFFRSCVGEKEGGTIYFMSKAIALINSCFDVCFTRGNYDQCYGTALYSNTQDILLERIAFFFCGPQGIQTGDSTCFNSASKRANFEYWNTSKCSNKWGSSGPYLFINTPEKYSVKYAVVAHCSGAHIFCCHKSSPCDAYYINILNTTTTSVQIYAATTIHFFHSHIYFLTTDEQLTGSLLFSDCYGNFERDGVNFSEGVSTAVYHAKRGDSCIIYNLDRSERILIQASLVISLSSFLVLLPKNVRCSLI